MQRQKLILQLLQEGMPQGAICAEVQCSKSTVSRLKQKAGETGKCFGELLQLPDDEFETFLRTRMTRVKRIFMEHSYNLCLS